jgi:hypothetical protein
MQRKIRRETLSGEQRLDRFMKQDGVVLFAFSTGIVLGQIVN